MKLRNIDGVVLAAGYSSRMGIFKPELKIDGITMIERTVLNMKKFCDKVLVVGGYKVERVSLLLSAYENVEVVYNENFKKGMFTSVKKGLENVSAERIFIQPADMPFISDKIYQSLVENQGDIIIPVFNGGKGHPVVISGNIKNKILMERDEERLDQIFERYGYKTVEVTDNSIFKDIDTVDDYKKYGSKTDDSI